MCYFAFDLREYTSSRSLKNIFCDEAYQQYCGARELSFRRS